MWARRSVERFLVLICVGRGRQSIEKKLYLDLLALSLYAEALANGRDGGGGTAILADFEEDAILSLELGVEETACGAGDVFFDVLG